MVTDDDRLIIAHCLRAGISTRALAMCFGTSPQTIRQIASEGDRCPDPIFGRYFHLGSQAEHTAQRLRAMFGVTYAHTETQTEAEMPGMRMMRCARSIGSFYNKLFVYERKNLDISQKCALGLENNSRTYIIPC